MGLPGTVTKSFKQVGLEFSVGTEFRIGPSLNSSSFLAVHPNSDYSIELISKLPSLIINLAMELCCSFQKENNQPYSTQIFITHNFPGLVMEGRLYSRAGHSIIKLSVPIRAETL